MSTITLIIALKHIATNPAVSADLLKKESTNTLVNLLKGVEEEVNYKVIEFFLKEEFKFMDTELELVLKSFNDVLKYLGMNNQEEYK